MSTVYMNAREELRKSVMLALGENVYTDESFTFLITSELLITNLEQIRLGLHGIEQRLKELEVTVLKPEQRGGPDE